VNDQRTIRIDGDFAEVLYDDGTRLLIGDTTAGQASDTYHTIDELYRHRALLSAALWGRLYEDESNHGRITDVHKARLHSDGTDIDGYFVVMATLPTGQISYHYPDADWDLFEIPQRTFADVWDGHASADVLDRLERYLRGA
jgi:hypothetical protein